MNELIPFENWHVEIELHLPGVENAAARIIHLKTFNWGKPTMWKCHKAMDIFRTPLSPPPASSDTKGGLFSKTAYWRDSR